jgi:hypothetical protein
MQGMEGIKWEITGDEGAIQTHLPCRVQEF